MQQDQQQQNEEDMDALRQLLENIVQLSFDQEANLDDLEATAVRDPHLVEIGRQQKKLRDDARLVEDSLFALSKRVPPVAGPGEPGNEPGERKHGPGHGPFGRSTGQ
jgi:hypothetical protein